MNTLRIAAIISSYTAMSHADVIVSRWLEPYPTDAEFGFKPQSKIVSMFIDQLPERDPEVVLPPIAERKMTFNLDVHLGHAISHRHGLPIFKSIEQALTCGMDDIAVDAVLLICEHGDFPINDIGVKLYPRKQYFDAIAKCMNKFGKSLPLFCDKHLSYSFDFAREMVQEAKALKMPFFAGSSLPYAGFYPAITNTEPIEEALAIFYVDPESYGYHSIEMVQTLLDRAADQQQGIRSVIGFKGQQVWDEFRRGNLPRKLLDEALSHAAEWSESALACEKPIVFQFEYVSGIKVTHIQFENRVERFIAAIQTSRGIFSGCSAIGRPCFANDGRQGTGQVDPRKESEVDLERRETFCSHFAVLCNKIEEFFITGQPPIPIERVLLTTGAVAAANVALAQPGERLVTPQLAFSYATRVEKALL